MNSQPCILVRLVGVSIERKGLDDLGKLEKTTDLSCPWLPLGRPCAARGLFLCCLLAVPTTFSADSTGKLMTQERRFSVKNDMPSCLSKPDKRTCKAWAFGSPPMCAIAGTAFGGFAKTAHSSQGPLYLALVCCSRGAGGKSEETED